MGETTVIKMNRYRYGASTLWAIRDHVCGSSARRLEELVHLFFRCHDGDLFLDLREAGTIDSAGAGALARCQCTHPAFGIVGLPPTWNDLPLEVRVALKSLGPAPDLASALIRGLRPAGAAVDTEQRRHARISLRIPVELCFKGRSALVSLCDISHGGVRLEMVPADWLPELLSDQAAFSFEILGLGADPLGGEIAGRGARKIVSASPVHVFPGIGLGARFLESHPPV